MFLKIEKLKKQREENLTIAPESENQTKRERIDTICQEWGDIAEDFGETNKNTLMGQLASRKE